MDEEQLKAALEIMAPALPNGTAMRVASFIPRVAGMDSESGKVVIR